jgi:hypothetical protein
VTTNHNDYAIDTIALYLAYLLAAAVHLMLLPFHLCPAGWWVRAPVLLYFDLRVAVLSVAAPHHGELLNKINPQLTVC